MEPQKPVGEAYTGPSGGLKKPSEWLASEDLPLDKDTKVTIEGVYLFKNVKFDAGRVEPKVAGIKFVGKEKFMILNATNRKRLVKAFTQDTKQWAGKEIWLYVDMQSKQVGGGVGPGLRIKTEVAPA